jgi:hypothetical protein
MQGNSLHQDLKDILVKSVLIGIPNGICVGKQSMTKRFRPPFAEQEHRNFVNKHGRSATETIIPNISFLNNITNTACRDGHPPDGPYRNPIHHLQWTIHPLLAQA